LTDVASESLIQEFQDIFHLPGDRLSFTPTIQHSIKLNSDKPIYIRQYRTPFKLQDEVARQVDALAQEELVQPSHSPYNFPLLVVPKKPGPDGEKKYRLVVDFRRLNEVTESNVYPMPDIEEILDRMGQSTLFSSYDLKSGFHQIEMAPECRHLLAFQGAGTHLEYVRMPFGLKNAPATMQRLMNTILSASETKGTPQKSLKAFVFMDDIVQHASSLAEMISVTRAMFMLLREHNLKLEPAKCQLFRKEISFLGHLVSAGVIRPCPDKVKSVKEFPRPKNPKDVKSLLGMAGYYRRFIPDFAHHQESLTNLTRSKVPFEWTDECESSYRYFQNCLIEHPIVRQFDPTKPVILTTDASE
jgi:Reverse transcriptase (RNA-dependent DNA polymerase)